jgi:hypothetical protein
MLSENSDTDFEGKIYRQLGGAVPIPDAAATIPQGPTFPDSAPYKKRPANWWQVRLDLYPEARAWDVCNADQLGLQQRAEAERWIGAGPPKNTRIYYYVSCSDISLFSRQLLFPYYW